MKKLLTLAVLLAMMAALPSCGGKSGTTTNSPKNTEVSYGGELDELSLNYDGADFLGKTLEEVEAYCVPQLDGEITFQSNEWPDDTEQSYWYNGVTFYFNEDNRCYCVDSFSEFCLIELKRNLSKEDLVKELEARGFICEEKPREEDYARHWLSRSTFEVYAYRENSPYVWCFTEIEGESGWGHISVAWMDEETFVPESLRNVELSDLIGKTRQEMREKYHATKPEYVCEEGSFYITFDGEGNDARVKRVYSTFPESTLFGQRADQNIFESLAHYRNKMGATIELSEDQYDDDNREVDVVCALDDLRWSVSDASWLDANNCVLWVEDYSGDPSYSAVEAHFPMAEEQAAVLRAQVLENLEDNLTGSLLADLDHDGTDDLIVILKPGASGTVYTVRVYVSSKEYNELLYFGGSVNAMGADLQSYYLVRYDGQDYLMTVWVNGNKILAKYFDISRNEGRNAFGDIQTYFGGGLETVLKSMESWELLLSNAPLEYYGMNDDASFEAPDPEDTYRSVVKGLKDRVNDHGWVTGSLMADLTHDGRPELIVIYDRDGKEGIFAARMRIYTLTDEWVATCIYETDVMDVMYAEGNYYLVEEDGKHYLMRYCTNYISGSGGMLNYYYELFALTEQGGEVVLRTDAIQTEDQIDSFMGRLKSITGRDGSIYLMGGLAQVRYTSGAELVNVALQKQNTEQNNASALKVDQLICTDEDAVTRTLGGSRDQLEQRGFRWEYNYGSVDTFIITKPGFSAMGLQVGDSRATVDAAVAGLAELETLDGSFAVVPPDIDSFSTNEGRSLYLQFYFSGNTVTEIRYGAMLLE